MCNERTICRFKPKADHLHTKGPSKEDQNIFTVLLFAILDIIHLSVNVFICGVVT